MIYRHDDGCTGIAGPERRVLWRERRLTKTPFIRGASYNVIFFLKSDVREIHGKAITDQITTNRTKRYERRTGTTWRINYDVS